MRLIALGLFAAASLVGLFTSACRSEGPEGETEFCGVLPGEVLHACEHGAAEPSGTVTAGPGAPVSGPLLQRTHALFEIELVAQGDGFGGEVRFLPARSGAYGIFAGSPVTLELHEQDGRSRGLAFATNETHCPHFATTWIVALEAEVPVTLRLTSTSEPHLRLLFERLGSSTAAVLTADCSNLDVRDASTAEGGEPAPGRDAAAADDAHASRADAGGPGELVDAQTDAPTDAEAGDSEPELDAAPGTELNGASPADAGDVGGDAAAECRTEGPCVDDSECCDYCHDYEHCH